MFSRFEESVQRYDDTDSACTNLIALILQYFQASSIGDHQTYPSNLRM